jgi:hypothetical protein
MQSAAFSMSSLILQRAEDEQPFEIVSDRRLARDSRLRFLTYVYNASRAKAPPEVMVSTQVLRDEKVVVATKPSRLRTEGTTDLARIPYFAELNLEGMANGSYVLQVIATDRATQATTLQRMNFEIEQ